MRAIILAALAALAAAPAQGQQLTEQIGSAATAFRLGLDNDGLMGGGYYDALSQDIGGTWVDVTGLPGTPDTTADDAGIAEACARQPLAISAGPAPLTLTFVLGGTSGAVTTTYTYAGGTTFATYADTTAYLRRLGLLERMDAARRQALLMLSTANASVSIYRPSTDVMVLVSERGLPRIIGRCSPEDPSIAAAEPATAGDSALADALGKTYDEQFGSSAPPEKRDQFVACALRVFAPLSEADRKLVIDTNFDPPTADRDRIEASYPELADGARACAEAAEPDAQP